MEKVIVIIIFIFFLGCKKDTTFDRTKVFDENQIKQKIIKNKKKEYKKISDSIVFIIDTVNEYVYEYNFNIKTNRRDGEFKSYYFDRDKKKKKELSCVSFYKNDILYSYCLIYENNKLITKYTDIYFNDKLKKYFADATTYDSAGNIKEFKKIKTTDEMDFAPLLDSISFYFDIVD